MCLYHSAGNFRAFNFVSHCRCRCLSVFLVEFGGIAIYLAWLSLCTAEFEPRQRLLGILGDAYRLRFDRFVQAIGSCNFGWCDVWVLCFVY